MLTPSRLSSLSSSADAVLNRSEVPGPWPERIPTTTAPFDTAFVQDTLRHMSQQSATCIDGWSSKLLQQAIECNATIAGDIGTIMAWMTDGQFGPLVMNILRLGRAVAIPKQDGSDGVRPITVSSFFSKLIGSLILRRTKPHCSAHQYAVNIQRGAERIVHLARSAFDDGMGIIRIDIANAFNCAQRSLIDRLLRGSHPDILQYFHMMYGPSAQLAVYGPQQIQFIQFEEGVRQGDAFSAYFFCLLMDQVLVEVKRACPAVQLWAYIFFFFSSVANKWHSA